MWLANPLDFLFWLVFFIFASEEQNGNLFPFCPSEAKRVNTPLLAAYPEAKPPLDTPWLATGRDSLSIGDQ